MKGDNVKQCDGLANFKIDHLQKISNHIKRLASDCLGNSRLSLIAQNLDKVLKIDEEERKIYNRKIKDLEKEIQLLRCQNKSSKHVNSQLSRENNNLRNKLLELEGNYKEELKKIKLCNKKLKNDLEDIQIIYSQTLREVKELEKESLDKNNKILQLTKNKSIFLNKDGKKKAISASYPVLGISKTLNEHKESLNKLWESRAQANDLNVINMVEIMERKCSTLMEEVHKLKSDNKSQSELITSLKQQVTQKDEELERLRKKLDESDSSPKSHSSDAGYCCHCQQIKCKIRKLEIQLMETTEKQHEAMTRAVQLAERNRNLERELKDIDQMAMAMEEECQSKVKQTARNVTCLQQKISEKDDEIRSLQSEIMDLKIRLDKEKLTVDKLNIEKKALERNLEDALRDKKCFNDKVNHYIVRERNLKTEITKLQEINKGLQKELNEFEEKLGDALAKVSKGKDKLKPKKKNPTLGLPTTANKTPSNCHFTSHKPTGRGDSKWEYQVDQLNSNHKSIDRDRMQEDFHCFCYRENRDLVDSNHHHCEHSLMGINHHRKLKEMEHEIEMLKQENLRLKRETSVRSKFEDGFNYCSSGDSLKIIIDRLERERDLALSDVSKLQTERDILRERIKLTTESQIGENSRMERIIMENEDRIRRLESERRELISSQGSQRANLTALEEKCEDYKTQLMNVQNDLCRVTAQYNQLKGLQDETDRSLAGIHGKLSHTQTELNFALNKLKELENANRNLEEQIAILKKEKSSLKANLACTEREKDDFLLSLDEKTELCSKLQIELKDRDKYIAELNERISNMQKQFDLIVKEKTARDHAVLSLERDVAHLREELEKCENQRDAFKRENRRLHDDLTSAIKDCQMARRQLDNEKIEVENLKRQLQQYVNEVKKAEELLFQKESERNEMLDHFRSLSIEATTLESNNHSLESAMETTKVELIAANSRLMNLEQEVATKESLVNSYENQIVNLTSRVAELESKLKQECEERYRVEEDLAALRDLCTTIDDQKESLRRKASDSDAEKLHLQNEVQRLHEEYEGLNDKLSRERTLAHTLEKSLSHSRQETLEHKISNKDLKSQVQQLQLKVDELTEKLAAEVENVQSYQNQCSELSNQVSELRREVTNVRFEKARALESNRRVLLSPPWRDSNELQYCTNETPDLSFRNIPPLAFLEDSDRTVSYEEDLLAYQIERDRPKIPYLSPAFREEDKYISKLEASSSELSSLPDDGLMKDDGKYDTAVFNCKDTTVKYGSSIAWIGGDVCCLRCIKHNSRSLEENENGWPRCVVERCFYKNVFNRHTSRSSLCGRTLICECSSGGGIFKERDEAASSPYSLKYPPVESGDKFNFAKVFKSENADGESDVNVRCQNYHEDFDQTTYSIDGENGSNGLST